MLTSLTKIDLFDAEFDWEVKTRTKPECGRKRVVSAVWRASRRLYATCHHVKVWRQPLTQYIELFEWRSPDQYLPPNGWHKFSAVGNSYIPSQCKI